MTHAGRSSADEIFFQSLELDEPQRPEFIARACGRNADLRAEVESLLAAHRRAGDFLRTPVVPGSSASASEAPAAGATGAERWIGRPIGSYRVVDVLGAGGMGAVLLAERADEQFQKRVAIKVIRAGMATDDVLRRFQHERQVLAQLDHPNIARLVDGGATDDGLPYLVMDCVEGLPIDRYCAQQRLSVTDRLRLFRRVCAPVQYAHQHLVVHRDLKPGNILITPEGEPRLLDFGIAKVLDPATAAAGPQTTAPALRLLTPRYASPEQLRGQAVTTASDVYSLGVILYELLTGLRPFSGDTDSAQELERLLNTQEPTRPSTAVRRAAQDRPTGRGAVSPTAAPAAGPPDTDGRRLSRRLSGDLDNIVLMALRREPQRRYASVAQLAEDIRRHLDGLPVAARADTFGYRVATFARRHAAAVAAAAILGVGLLAATIVSTRMYIRADGARLAAERAEAQAEAQRAIAEQINTFLQDMLASPDPVRAGPNVLVRTLLDTAAGRIPASDLAGKQPAIEAAIRATLGNTYRALGLHDAAEPHLVRAVELRRAARVAGGASPLELAASVVDLAALRHAQAQFDAAETLYREALALRTDYPAAGAPRLADIRSSLAALHSVRGEFDAAESLFRAALDECQRDLGPDDPRVATGLDHLGTLLHRRGEHAAAEPLLRRALDIRVAAFGPEHSDVLNSLSSLALVVRDRGDDAAAEQLLVEAVRVARKVVGDDHPTLALTLNNLAVLHLRRGNPDAAEAPIREALAIRRERLGPQHPEVAATLNSLAALLKARGALDEAGERYQEALAIYRQAFSDDHPETVTVMNNLAALLFARDDLAGAARLFRDALGARRRILPAHHPDLPISMNNLAVVLIDLRAGAEAAELLREAVALQRQILPPEHPNLAGSLVNLGAALFDVQSYNQAETVLREGLNIREKQLPAAHPLSGAARVLLGLALQGQGRFEDGAPLVAEGARAVLAGASVRQQRTALQRIVRAYETWEQPAAAAEYQALLAGVARPAEASRPQP